jgi:TatD DNase family protein
LHELVDIGINLAHDSFDHDRADVIARAARAGVTRMVITGSSVASSRAAIGLLKVTRSDSAAPLECIRTTPRS